MNSVNVYYTVNNYFNKFMLGKSDVPVKLGTTHVRIPCRMPVNNMNAAPLLDVVFSYFNWVQFNGEAPKHINDYAQANNTHASMSVGDIVKINETYYMCAFSGWTEINVC